ncbi:unnamed protein product [Pedinophyceae sp. YPF-701]|nr:unnamed protein product [Pedinophyceae sp. YPF-701]
MRSARDSLNLEVFKFGVYLAIPALLTAWCADPDRVAWLANTKRYIVYPSTQHTRESYQEQLEKVDEIVDGKGRQNRKA